MTTIIDDNELRRLGLTSFGSRPKPSPPWPNAWTIDSWLRAVSARLRGKNRRHRHGKSGHIGGKIAATLAALEAPLFCPSGEASMAIWV